MLRRYFDEMTIVLESHGGVIAKIIGDALVAVFDGAEDPHRAARRAARAAVEAQAALLWLNDRFDATWGVRLENRTGVASGPLPQVVLEDWSADDEVLAGEVLACAESLEAGAPVMEALIDDRTLALVGDAATVEPVGTVPRRSGGGTVPAWRLLTVRAPLADAGPDRPTGAARLCDVCGLANAPDARWCDACGSALSTGDTARESRRMVTILFADPTPRAIDGAALAADTTKIVMTRYYAAMRPILERHGATVEKFIGDALMAVFGLPVRHEDDALRAVRAASAMQAALVDLNAEVAADFGVAFAQPIGVNTGTVVAGDAAAGQRLVTGDAVNVAARFEQLAGPHDVVMGALTRQLVGDLVTTDALPPLQLKGKSEPVPAHRLVDIAGVGGHGGRQHLPLVGREDELAALRRALRSVITEGRPGRITLVGDAGLGKSRLTEEFLVEAGGTARILQGSCLAYGDGITFWALLEMIHDAAGIVEHDDAGVARARIAELVGGRSDVLARIESIAGLVDAPYPVDELVWAMRWLVDRFADDGPVVLVFHDIHWGEPTFLEVVEQLTAAIAGPVLLVCTARPAALERHRDFVTDAPTVVVTPLTDEQCERFLLLLLGDTAIDPAVVRDIAAAAGGNPLFLEQFLSMLIDDGRLRHDDGRWRAVGDMSVLNVPPSIEAVVAARLDRLSGRERRIIEPASVIGRAFAQDAVVGLVDRDVRPRVPDGLVALTDRELVERADAEEPSYRFQHQLIRDATYGGLLKESRAILHERFVRWLDAREELRERSIELTEIQGYHLEQAYHYWRELGLIDPHVVDVGVDASRRLASAGERALARGDMPAAASLLLRASELLPEVHDSRPRTLLLAGGALDEAGRFDDAIAAFESSASAAERAGNGAAVEAARISRSRLEYLTGRGADSEQIGREVDRALHRLASLGDADALSRAWQLRVDVDIAACRWAAAQRAASEVIDHARRAGNTILELRTMRLLAFLAQKGPMRVPEAITTCRGILERVSADRRSAAVTRVDLALLTAMTLDFPAARTLCAEARDTLRDLGAQMQAALVSLGSGPIELLADEPARAEAELRADLSALERMGERNFISLTAALLAEAVYRQQRFSEARDLLAFSREVAAPDDLAVQIIGGCVSGKLTARSGDTGAGVAQVRAAVQLIETTEDPSGRADAWLDLAETLHLDDQPAEPAAARARDLYLEKGNLAGVRRAERVGRMLRAGRDPLGRP